MLIVWLGVAAAPNHPRAKRFACFIGLNGGNPLQAHQSAATQVAVKLFNSCESLSAATQVAV